MIDFKKVAKNSGQKAWLHTQLPKIPALRWASGKEDDGPGEQVEVEFEIRRGEGNLAGEWWLHLHGGPTGYESVNLLHILENKEVGAKWVACMGSNRYARMEVRIDNIRHAVSNYNVNHRFEVL